MDDLINLEALKIAATVGLINYIFSTYWLTVGSVLWQTWGNIALSPETMDKLRIPNEGLWSMARNSSPLQLHWFPFWTQAKIRAFVLLSGLLYMLVANFGTDIGNALVSLSIMGLFISLVFQGVLVALSDKFHWSRIIYTLINGTALVAIIHVAFKH